jgi:hypothetical protein
VADKPAGTEGRQPIAGPQPDPQVRIVARPVAPGCARGGPAVISGWEVRLFVSSGLGRRGCGEITVHRGEESVRTCAERGLTRLCAERRGVGPDTCLVATVERPGERITCYLLPEGTLDWDAVRERG